MGRIVIGLYGQVVPKTVGEMGKGVSGKILHYKGTPFHRIISGFVIQGGDIVRRDGRGSESIYGGTFLDENFKIKHSHAGFRVLAMVNTGPNSNGSQFFITTVKASWLDGEHVVFGKVMQGMDTVYAIEGGAGTYNGKPRKKVIIIDSDEDTGKQMIAQADAASALVIEWQIEGRLGGISGNAAAGFQPGTAQCHQYSNAGPPLSYSMAKGGSTSTKGRRQGGRRPSSTMFLDFGHQQFTNMTLSLWLEISIVDNITIKSSMGHDPVV
ncbi:hypothetical protein ACLOJK_014927 [Asimina triloba]